MQVVVVKQNMNLNYKKKKKKFSEALLWLWPLCESWSLHIRGCSKNKSHFGCCYFFISWMKINKGKHFSELSFQREWFVFWKRIILCWGTFKHVVIAIKVLSPKSVKRKSNYKNLLIANADKTNYNKWNEKHKAVYI